MAEPSVEFNFISWNVRGLNSRVKQEEVKQVMQVHKPSIVCLQETKLSNITDLTFTQCMGSAYVHNFWFLPAEGTRGGILLACREARYQFSKDLIRDYTISMVVIDCWTEN
jgi:exonuclease III